MSLRWEAFELDHNMGLFHVVDGEFQDGGSFIGHFIAVTRAGESITVFHRCAHKK